jgi:hypothetical protein
MFISKPSIFCFTVQRVNSSFPSVAFSSLTGVHEYQKVLFCRCVRSGSAP